MENKKVYKQIFSLRLAGYLMQMGFRIRRIHHNLKEIDKDVYLFDDTPELENAMLEYKKLKQTKEKYYGDNKQNGKSNTAWKEHKAL